MLKYIAKSVLIWYYSLKGDDVMSRSEIYSTYKNSILFYEHRTSYDVENTIIAAHTHESYEIILLKEGKIKYSVEGKNYKLKKNSIIFTRPHQIHSIKVRSNEYERYNIAADFTKLPASFYDEIPADLDVINCDGNRYLLSVFEQLDYYLNNGDRQNIDIIVNNLIMEILYNMNIEAGQYHRQNFVSINPIIEAATLYIEQNLTTVEGVEEICNNLFITKSHLHHLFTKHLQTSPKQYITAKRLGLAQNKIRAGAKATDIYQGCGFNDYTTFFRNYVKHFGYSPSSEAEHEVKLEIK